MLRHTKDLKGFVIRATDGEIGSVEQFYFDDETWGIRYLVVDTGGWLGGRLVLISPMSITGPPDWESKRLDVSLTKEQVKNCPDLNTDQPVSRQHESAYLGYYGYPFYWGGADLWGSVSYPAALLLQPNPMEPEVSTVDSHLRSSHEIVGYHIEASNGEIGHVDGFIVDDETWAIRYIEVGTRNWWPGKKVLISPAWIKTVSWEDMRVYAALSREAIQSGPEYDESLAVTRDYEAQLYSHYGHPHYWKS